MTEIPTPTRLSPERQAEYQQVFNDPDRTGSPEWDAAARALAAAGLIEPSHDGDADIGDASRDLTRLTGEDLA